jgi:DNA-binding transcriptional LysR family regulator
VPLISAAATWLIEVAKAGSIRRAAAQLNVSPSAVNRQILNLEAEYGADLFERLPRGVRLTAAGEILVAEIQRWHHDQSRALRHLSQLRGTIRGHAAIGLMESLGQSVVSRLMTFMRERHSQVSLDIVIGGTAHLVERLVGGTLDLAICYAVPRQPEIDFLATATSTSGIVVARNHPLASRKSIRLADCADYSFVIPDASLTVRRVLDNAFEKAKMHPVSVVTTNSIEVMKMLVREHGQIAMLGLIDVRSDLDVGDLVHIPFSDHQVAGSGLSLIARKHAQLSPVAAVLAEHLKEYLNSGPAGRP